MADYQRLKWPAFTGLIQKMSKNISKTIKQKYRTRDLYEAAADTEANARAKTLIYLIENKLLDLDKEQ